MPWNPDWLNPLTYLGILAFLLVCFYLGIALGKAIKYELWLRSQVALYQFLRVSGRILPPSKLDTRLTASFTIIDDPVLPPEQQEEFKEKLKEHMETNPPIMLGKIGMEVVPLTSKYKKCFVVSNYQRAKQLQALFGNEWVVAAIGGSLMGCQFDAVVFAPDWDSGNTPIVECFEWVRARILVRYCGAQGNFIYMGAFTDEYPFPTVGHDGLT